MCRKATEKRGGVSVEGAKEGREGEGDDTMCMDGILCKSCTLARAYFSHPPLLLPSPSPSPSPPTVNVKATSMRAGYECLDESHVTLSSPTFVLWPFSTRGELMLKFFKGKYWF